MTGHAGEKGPGQGRKRPPATRPGRAHNGEAVNCGSRMDAHGAAEMARLALGPCPNCGHKDW